MTFGYSDKPRTHGPPFTALIADLRSERRPEHKAAPLVREALRVAISDLRRGCLSASGYLRVLAGVAGEAESHAADVAAEEGIPLHLLAAGLPMPLSASQALAERQTWLGADAQDMGTEEPQVLLDEIALGFTDLLIVVWDGLTDEDLLEAADRRVLMAALAMKPIVWISPSGAIRVLDRTRLTQAKRHLLMCPRPSSKTLVECFSESLDHSGVRSELLRTVTHAMSDSASSGEVAAAGKSHAGTVHKVMMALVQGKFGRACSSMAASPIGAYRGQAWLASTSLLAPTPALDARFDAADIAATVAAGKHRSSAWVSAMASTTAVFAAVVGAIRLWSGEHGAVWAVLELTLIALVVSILWRAKQKQWHSRWIGSRFIAEQLRYARMGLPLLALTKSQRESWSRVMVDAHGVNQLVALSSDLRSVQMTVTQLGLPEPLVDGPYVAASAEALPRLRDYVLSVVKDQIGYHERTHNEQHAIQHVLHTFSLALFCLTGAAVAGHFFLHAPWLLIFTAYFPALAAGIHGLTTTLEVSRVADQSRATAAALRDLHEAISNVLTAESSAWRQWLQLRHLTLLSAEIMSDENSQWQKLVTHQKPGLPA